MKLRLRLALAAAAVFLLSASPAQAELAYKTGPEFNTAQGNCFPLRAWASYTQQRNGGVATEPRVDDVFWISVDYSFFQTFDCAADFASAEVTLTVGVAPVGGVKPICRRIGGQSPNYVYDQRATNVCPDAVSFNAGTRKFNVVPKAGSNVDFPASGRWFMGQRAPQENVVYHTLQLLVPVRATQTITNQPIGLQACTVGTSCASGGVPLTVTPAPQAADPPRISFAGHAQTSAVGARIPFSINSPDTNPEFGLKLDISENAAFNGARPCGQTGPQILPEGESQVYVGDHDGVDFLYGDLDHMAPDPCLLDPGTTYHLKACTVYFTGPTTYTEQHCQTTSFTTGAVGTRFTPPGTGTTSSIAVRALQVVGAHPAGSLSLRYRVKGSGSGFAAGPSQSVGRSMGDSPPADRVIGGLAPGRAYEIVSCFQVAGGGQFCSDPVTARTQAATAPRPAGPGAGGGGGGRGGGGGPAADTQAPRASLRLKGKLRRGKKVKLTVSATDPSGIRSVTIKVGKRKARRARTLTIRLPRRKAKVTVVVRVTDGAGNVATLRRTLRVK